MQVYLFILTKWNDTLAERVEALSKHVDEVVLFRTKPGKSTSEDTLANVDNLKVVDTYPQRDEFVDLLWVHPILFSFQMLQAVLFALLLSLRRRRRPDVVHSLDYVISGLPGVVVSTLMLVPFVVSVRGILDLRYKNIVKEKGSSVGKLNYHLMKWVSNFVFSRTEAIITKADYQVDKISSEYDVRGASFESIPTGVDFDLFDPGELSPDEQVPDVLPDDVIEKFRTGRIALHLGRLTPGKGVDDVISHLRDCLTELPDDFHMLFVGEFHDAQFQSRVDSLTDPISDRITVYPNRVPFSSVPGLIGAADVMVLLSEPDQEGVPRVLQEACAMDTPIVASDVTGITGTFEDVSGCWLVNPNSSDDFCEALAEALSADPYGMREQTRDRFEMYENYRKYAEVYRKLIVSF